MAQSLRWTVMCLAAVAAGCEPTVTRPRERRPEGVVTILFSAQNEGVLSACGCMSNPSGGLAKRQTVIDRARRAGSDVLLLDGGDLLPERPNDPKLPYLARAVGRADYDAIAAGDQEFLPGPERLRALAEEYGLPLLCANVRDAAGRRVFPPHRVVEAGGFRIGVFAVVADRAYGRPPREWRQGLRIEPPKSASRREVEALAGCDLVVALAHVPMGEVEDLARTVPGIDLIISGQDEGVLEEPRRIGTATVVGTGACGRVMGALTVTRTAEDGGWEMDLALTGLSEKVADTKWVLDLYWDYVRSAKDKAIPEWELTPVPAAYEPPEACRKCHEQEYAQWSTTAHAHAFEVLRKAGRHQDPACILCHTMGYGREGGFVTIDRTPRLGRITCQACHVVTSDHGKKGERPHERLDAKEWINARLCMGCHGLIESPHFDYRAYRPRIVHTASAPGKGASKRPGTEGPAPGGEAAHRARDGEKTLPRRGMDTGHAEGP